MESSGGSQILFSLDSRKPGRQIYCISYIQALFWYQAFLGRWLGMHPLLSCIEIYHLAYEVFLAETQVMHLFDQLPSSSVILVGNQCVYKTQIVRSGFDTMKSDGP